MLGVMDIVNDDTGDVGRSLGGGTVLPLVRIYVRVGGRFKHAFQDSWGLWVHQKYLKIMY